MDEPGYGIGEVSERTGIAVPVLRMWESRFGFPRPARRAERAPPLQRGATCELLRQVVRDREAGLSLTAAIEQARGALDEAPATVFAGLRRTPRGPGPVLLTQAHDDEHQPRDRGRVLRARGAGGAVRVVPARALLPRGPERRWRDLARTRRARDRVRRLRPQAQAARRARRAAARPATIRSSREWSIDLRRRRLRRLPRGMGAAGPGGARRTCERRFETLWSIEAGRGARGDARGARAGRAVGPRAGERPARAAARQAAPGSEDVRTLDLADEPDARLRRRPASASVCGATQQRRDACRGGSRRCGAGRGARTRRGRATRAARRESRSGSCPSSACRRRAPARTCACAPTACRGRAPGSR